MLDPQQQQDDSALFDAVKRARTPSREDVEADVATSRLKLDGAMSKADKATAQMNTAPRRSVTASPDDALLNSVRRVTGAKSSFSWSQGGDTSPIKHAPYATTTPAAMPAATSADSPSLGQPGASFQSNYHTPTERRFNQAFMQPPKPLVPSPLKPVARVSPRTIAASVAMKKQPEPENPNWQVVEPGKPMSEVDAAVVRQWNTASEREAQDEARREAANQAISAHIGGQIGLPGLKLPRILTEGLADIAGGLESGIGAAVKGISEPGPFQPAANIPGVRDALRATAGKAGSAMQSQGAEVSGLAGAPEGIRKDIGTGVGEVIPALAAKNPLMVGALAYTQAKGRGASEEEAIEHGLKSAATVGAMGKAANAVGRAIPGAGVGRAVTRIAGRAAANLAIPSVIDAPEKIIAGESPVPTEREVMANLPQVVGFAMMPHSVEPQGKESLKAKTVMTFNDAGEPVYLPGKPEIPRPGLIRRAESAVMDTGRARVGYEAQRAAQEQADFPRVPTLVKGASPVRAESPARNAPPSPASGQAPQRGDFETGLEGIGQQSAQPLRATPSEPTATPEWVRQNIEVLTAGVEKSGIAGRVEELSAQRKTAQQAASELGIEKDVVRAVRAKRGIPSMDDTDEFNQWLDSRQSRAETRLADTPDGRNRATVPQVITTTPNLTRNFRAGTNDASMTFESPEQRDLYDLGAKMRYQSMGGQNKTQQRAVGDIAGLRKSLADRLGVPEADVSRMAMDTLNDVKAQMKSVQHLEERALKNNVTAPEKTVTTIRPNKTAARTVSPRSDSLLAAIQKLGIDPDRGDVGRLLKESGKQRPGMINRQRSHGQARGDDWLVDQLEQNGWHFDDDVTMKKTDQLAEMVNRELMGKPVYSRDYDHVAHAEEEIARMADEFPHDEVHRSDAEKVRALFSDPDAQNVVEKVSSGAYNQADWDAFEGIARYQYGLSEEAINGLREEAEASLHTAGGELRDERPAASGVEASQSAVSAAQRGAVRDAAKETGDVDGPIPGAYRDSEAQSVPRPLRDVDGPASGDAAGNYRAAQPNAPSSDQLSRVSGIPESLKQQARDSNRTLANLVEDRISQTALPGFESQQLTADDATLLRQMATRAPNRAPVAEKQGGLLDVAPTLESKQAQTAVIEDAQSRGAANAPLFEGVKAKKQPYEMTPAERAEYYEPIKMDSGHGYNRRDYVADYWPIEKIKQTEFPATSDIGPVLDRYKREIQEGTVKPVVVHEATNGILNGNHRYLAYRESGVKEVPVLVAKNGDGTGQVDVKPLAARAAAEGKTVAPDLQPHHSNFQPRDTDSGQFVEGKPVDEAKVQAFHKQLLESGKSVDQYLSQPELFGDELTPGEREHLRSLGEPARQAISEHGQFARFLFHASERGKGDAFLDDPAVKTSLGLPKSANMTAVHNRLRAELGMETNRKVSPESLYGWAADKQLPHSSIEKIARAHKSALDLADSIAARKATEGGFLRLPSGREVRKAGRVLMDKQTWLDIANVPRTLKASLDLSAPLRQGAIFSLTEPRLSFRAGRDMLKALVASKDGYTRLQEDIDSHPDYIDAQQAGVEFTGDVREFGGREEAFMSRFAGSIPGVRHSEQAYVTFLNSQRLYAYSKFAEQLRAAGKDFNTDPKPFYDIARFINAATGRGDVGKLADNTKALLNTVFFSPRYIASRVQVLNPREYYQMDSAARKIAMKKMFEYSAAVGTAMGLAALAGAKVGMNPDDSDFGKIVVGNTRYDATAGFAQYLRFTYNLASDFKSGEVKKAVDTTMRFARSKLAPVPGAAVNLYSGKDFAGQLVTLGGEAVDQITPLIVKDAYDGWKDAGALGIAKTVPASMAGVGVGTYKKAEQPTRTADEQQIHSAYRVANPLPPPTELKKTQLDAKSEIERAMRSHDPNVSQIIKKRRDAGTINEDDVYDVAAKVAKSQSEISRDEFKKLDLERMLELFPKLSKEKRKEYAEDMEDKAMDTLPKMTPYQQRQLGPKVGQALRAQ